MTDTWLYALWFLGVYLLASISPGDVIARRAGVDIRALGTGNPGTLNVYLEVGAKHGVLVLLSDVATGAIATVPLLLVDALGWARLGSVSAVLIGHMFPVFWHFRGGVGGAVGMGTAFGLLPLGALVAVAAALVTVGLSRTAIVAVWAFFGVTIAVGWAVEGDAAGLSGIVLAITMSTLKWIVHYRIHSPIEAKAWFKASERPWRRETT